MNCRKELEHPLNVGKRYSQKEQPRVEDDRIQDMATAWIAIGKMTAQADEPTRHSRGINGRLSTTTRQE
jgi:hypothetical protein